MKKKDTQKVIGRVNIKFDVESEFRVKSDF